jgi:phytoene synthase
MVARRYPGLYPLALLAVPAGWQPQLLALCAFAAQVDCLVDVPAGRADPDRTRAWSDGVRRALATGRAREPHLRAFLHTVAVHGIRHRDVHDYLAGQAERQWITAYATEQDHEDHLDRVSMPLVRMIHAVTHAPGEPAPEELLRPVIDAMQRTDDLADLSADLRRGLLTVPHTELLRFGVTRGELESGRGSEGVRALLAHRHAAACAVLDTAFDTLARTDAATRLFYQPWLTGCHAALSGVARLGPALPRRGVLLHARPSPAHLAVGAARTARARLDVALHSVHHRRQTETRDRTQAEALTLW